MKKQLLFLLSLSVLIICSCATHRSGNPHAKSTPGCVAINATLLCDQTEMNNFSWLEYEYWTKRHYGEDSKQYKAIQLNESAWSDFECLDTLSDYYLRHPAYRNYPIVGITQEQAIAYSKWRSDRVFEYVLVKKKILDFYSAPRDSASTFSIERYFEGNYIHPWVHKGDTTYERIVPDFSIPYPEYRLPTAEERLLILDYIDSTDFAFHQKKEKKYAQWRENNLPFYLAQEPCIEDSLVSEPVRSVRHTLDKHNQFNLIHNSRGNVAEWGAEPEITYGGGWPHNVEYTLSKDTISTTGSNAWTGFRNVCEWRYWKKD